jgi:hypothetical protein
MYVSRSLAFHARISLDFSLSFHSTSRENFPVCACFSGRADFHIPAARLLVGNYYQDAERENIVAFVRCSSAIKKERPFSCFLSFSFPLALFSFSFLRSLYNKSARRLYSPRSVMLIFCVHCRLRCAVVARARLFFH